MAENWSVLPGLGLAGGGGPVAATVTSFQIKKPDGSVLSATFAGVGGTVGGPVSLTYSDRETTGYPGDIIWAWGRQPSEIWLKNPTSGLILTLGTAPRQLLGSLGFPQDPQKISGFYVSLVAFGVTSETSAAASIMADIQFKTKGKLLTGASAYAAVASLAKGVDLGGASALAGSWLFI